MKADARASQQFLLLSHLYSQKADAAALARLRKELLRPKYTSLEIAMGSVLGVGAVGGTCPPPLAPSLFTPTQPLSSWPHFPGICCHCILWLLHVLQGPCHRTIQTGQPTACDRAIQTNDSKLHEGRDAQPTIYQLQMSCCLPELTVILPPL